MKQNLQVYTDLWFLNILSFPWIVGLVILFWIYQLKLMQNRRKFEGIIFLNLIIMEVIWYANGWNCYDMMQDSYFRFVGCRVHTWTNSDFCDLFGCDFHTWYKWRWMWGSYLDENLCLKHFLSEIIWLTINLIRYDRANYNWMIH